jgi:hypothetical protein
VIVSHWRTASRRIILKVLLDTQGQSEEEIKKALHDAYPFGERKMYPYKIWLDEVKRGRKTLLALQKQQQLMETI